MHTLCFRSAAATSPKGVFYGLSSSRGTAEPRFCKTDWEAPLQKTFLRTSERLFLCFSLCLQLLLKNMCTGSCAKCLGTTLIPLAVLCTVANILLFFPGGKVAEQNDHITDEVWYFGGILGSGVLVSTSIRTLPPFFPHPNQNFTLLNFLSSSNAVSNTANSSLINKLKIMK